MAEISFLHHVWILIIIGSLRSVHLQDVTIRRLGDNQGPVCPGQRLSFQCTTVGSAGIAWRSTDYIGSYLVQIGFLDSEKLSTQKRSTKFNDTVAELTSKGSRVLTSMLTVTVTSRNLNPSITCINDDFGTETTSSFNVIGDPGVPTITENPVLWEDTQGSCLLTISWTVVTNVSHYTVSINATLEINETLTIASVKVPECRSYGVRVRSVNQCGDKSPFSPETLPDMENIRPLTSFVKDSPDSFTTDDVPVCTNPPREPCDDCSRSSTASAVVIVVTVVIFVVVLLIVTVVLIIWYTRKLKKDCNRKGKSSNCCSAKNEAVPVTGSEPPHTDLETVNASRLL